MSPWSGSVGGPRGTSVWVMVPTLPWALGEGSELEHLLESVFLSNFLEKRLFEYKALVLDVDFHEKHIKSIVL